MHPNSFVVNRSIEENETCSFNILAHSFDRVATPCRYIQSTLSSKMFREYRSHAKRSKRYLTLPIGEGQIGKDQLLFGYFQTGYSNSLVQGSSPCVREHRGEKKRDYFYPGMFPSPRSKMIRKIYRALQVLLAVFLCSRSQTFLLGSSGP